MKQFTTSFIALLLAFSAAAQVEHSSDVYRDIHVSDSLLFEVGFNTCRPDILEELISEKFTFYHDQAGITDSKGEFVESVRSGLCMLPYRAVRVLDDSSVEVFPLRNNETLYGAIQSGRHRFYAFEGDNQKFLTSVARFTHVWVVEDGKWRLQSVLSYDHQDFDNWNSENGLLIDNQATGMWLKQKHIPSVAIGFIDNEQIIQTSVFGELEPGEHAPLQTIWNVASLTKPITALVALKLVDQGVLELNDPVSTYYSESELKDDPRYHQLTIGMILSHQSGLPNWRGDRADGKLQFEFDPGQKYQYSGEGYDLLRKVLEFKCDKPIQQLAEELIFKPLHMTSTSFVWKNEMGNDPVAKWHNAKGERYEFNKFHEANGADNLLTTIEDYSRFVLFILQGAGLSNELQDEMVAN